jgi:RimJ/RimL family protein N-acetyltransferase
MKQIIVGCEEYVVGFMEQHCQVMNAYSPRTGRAMAVIERDDDGSIDVLAAVWFDGFNGANLNLHVAAKPGAQWLTRKFANIVFHYAFIQLGAKRVTGLVEENNYKARRFDEKLGFTLETKLKDASPYGDMLVYVMRRDDCKWLHTRNALPLTRLGVN